MCYVERIIEQLRRRGVVKIVIQVTEYYEEYGDYAGQCDFILTYEMTDDSWTSTTYVSDNNENNLSEEVVWDTHDDVIDNIIDYLYCGQYAVSSIKTYTEYDAIGVDVDY